MRIPGRHRFHGAGRTALLGRRALQVLRQTGLARYLSPVATARFIRDLVRSRTLSPFVLPHLHALHSPERPALVAGSLRLSYGELDARINRLAHGLHSLGIGPGDRVAMMLHNGPEWLELTAAYSYLRAIGVQVGYRLKPKEVAYLLENSGAKALIFHATFASTVEGALAEMGPIGPARQRCIAIADSGQPRAAFDSYDELLARGRADGPPSVRGQGGGGLMVYTSGTTGRSKGARRDFGQTGFEPVFDFMAQLPIRCDERHLVACPLYHAMAPAFVALTLAVGGCLVILDQFEPAEVLATLERERITSALMVPTMYRRLLELGLPELRKRDLSSLRWLVSGAAPLPTTLADEIETAFGPILYNFYGATETGFVTLAKPGEHTARPGTIGRLLAGNEARLLDAEGREVPIGQVGELYIKNPMLVSGYHGNAEATQKAQRDGFFSVGDLARCDEDGYYFLADRKDDMVISGGVNVYPFEIEQRLHQHPAIAEAAVVGVPDPQWGESLAAFVVLRQAQEKPSIEALQHFVTDELADYKRPRQILFVEALPRNPTGKILKKELKARLAPTV